MKSPLIVKMLLPVCLILFSGTLTPLLSMGSKPRPDFACEPTGRDALGPFYKPDAPVRSRVGQGYLLSGTVKSALDCAPIEKAKIEFWLTGPGGDYDDDHRATVFSDGSGRYRFESSLPTTYGRRPPHIHIRVSAGGYQTLITQHYPRAGAEEAEYELVLIPSP